MNSGPSKIAEAIVFVLLPPACREEVVGDLHERFKSPLQYAAEALHTVPLVIASRMSRTLDPQALLMQAFALYLSFLGAAWFNDIAVLRQRWTLFRLAVPVMMIVIGLILDDTYANPGRRSALNLVRAPLLGIILALASEQVLVICDPDLAVPRLVFFYGCAASLLLSSALRMLFPPVTGQLLGANAPAFWLKQAGASSENPAKIVRALKGIAAVVTVVTIGTWLAESSVPPRSVVMILAIVFVAYQICRRV